MTGCRVRPWAVTLMVLGAPAWALPESVPAFDLERLVWNAGGQSTLLAQTGDGLAKGSLRLTLPTHYQHAPLKYVEGGQVIGNVIGGRLSSSLAAALGIFDWLEAGLQLPVVWAQGGDDLANVNLVSPRRFALGALALQVRFTPIRQDRGGPLDLGLSLAVNVPLGDAFALTRDPGWGLAFVPRLGAGRRFDWFRVGGEVGAVVRGAVTLSPGSQVVSDQVGTSLTTALAVSAHLQAFTGELVLRFHLPLTTTPVSAELQAAVRYGFFDRRFEVGLFGGAGFGATPGVPAFRLGLSLGWTPNLLWK